MANLSPCPIWGGGSQINRTLDAIEIQNPRAGGRYRITGSGHAILPHRYTTELAAKLTTWILEQHKGGEVSPLITSEILKTVQERPRLTISQQMDQFFLLLLNRRFRASSRLKQAGVVDEAQKTDINDMLIWMECEDDRERREILRLLHQQELINIAGDYITLMPAGVTRLEAIQKTNANSKQAFVAMWFDSSMEEAFQSGFAKAIEGAGYRPLRIDKKEHNNKIDDEIVAEIKRSRFIVADFTSGTSEGGDAIARGGVYFEAGFAMGLGIPVIWSCRKDLIDKVHFDTRQFAHVVWETPADLEKSLLNRIRAVIPDTA
jgi:hypothetical protein